ncbi:hypothetical protein FPOAC2_13182 [Fusarium poae]
MDSERTIKIQPWKAGWLARNAAGTQKIKTNGTSHGAGKGEPVIIGGFTSGVAIKMTPEKTQ